MYRKTGIGVPVGLRSAAPPNLGQVKTTITLSKSAKLRLKWLDYYFAHSSNATLTARHFGISMSCFNKWKARYNKHGLRGLEECSTRPNHVRRSLLPIEVSSTIRSLRRANSELSKYKLAVILKRDFSYQVSASTVGRIISRHNLFFTPPIKKKKHPSRRQSVTRQRKPKDFTAIVSGSQYNQQLVSLQDDLILTNN